MSQHRAALTDKALERALGPPQAAQAEAQGREYGSHVKRLRYPVPVLTTEPGSEGVDLRLVLLLIGMMPRRVSLGHGAGSPPCPRRTIRLDVTGIHIGPAAASQFRLLGAGHGAPPVGLCFAPTREAVSAKPASVAPRGPFGPGLA